MEDRLAAAGGVLNGANQTHLLTLWDKLPNEKKLSLLDSIEGIDFARLDQIYQKATATSAGKAVEYLAPAEVKWSSGGERPEALDVHRCTTTRLDSTPLQVQGRWKQHGLSMISRGEVAVVLLAGGQGTRLGHDAPKGCFAAAPVSKCSLFQVFCERLAKLKQLAESDIDIPLYIMTSRQNDKASRGFFEDHAFFGLPKESVKFFVQNEIPCLDAEGKVLLESDHEIAKNPNGNGGVFDALRASGSLNEMRARGVKGLHVTGVDNLLTKIGDPTFVGFVDECGAQVGNKCCERTDASEAVGVLCIRRLGTVESTIVLEYFEQTPQFKEMDPESGRLKFCSANICNHYFTLSFIESLVQKNLMDANYFCHAAAKKIPHFDIKSESWISPQTANGVKLECFIFDAFEHATSVVGLVGNREEEFSPIKNATGKDSHETAIRMMSALHSTWLKAAGASIQVPPESALICEVRPRISYEGEGLEGICKGKQFVSPVLIDRI